MKISVKLARRVERSPVRLGVCRQGYVREVVRCPYEKGRSSSGDSSWYSSWSDVCHKTSLGWRCPIPIVGDNCPSSTATVFGSSSFHLSMERRRAFMKKFPTVVGSRPNCLAIVTCISFDGLLVSCGKRKICIFHIKICARYFICFVT